MNSQTQAYFYALAASTCFSIASLIFTDIARAISPLWMNAFKALVAWVSFGAVLFAAGLWVHVPLNVHLGLLLSGVVGLAVGDIFLLTAYVRMGSARTLILFGFQPLFMGVAAHFFFGQQMSWLHSLAVLFFIICLFIFSLEKYKKYGHWEVLGLVAALLGVLLDNTGLLITRWCFDQAVEMTSFQANFTRCSGALLFFLACAGLGRLHFMQGWSRLLPRSRALVAGASFIGTFFSLLLYLTAIKIGHLATISALGAATPILSAVFESVYQRRLPSGYLLLSLGFFICGFSILALF